MCKGPGVGEDLTYSIHEEIRKVGTRGIREEKSGRCTWLEQRYGALRVEGKWGARTRQY